MVMVQIDMNEEENQILELFKAINKLKNKEDAIKRLIIEKKEDFKDFLKKEDEDGL